MAMTARVSTPDPLPIVPVIKPEKELLPLISAIELVKRYSGDSDDDTEMARLLDTEDASLRFTVTTPPTFTHTTDLSQPGQSIYPHAYLPHLSPPSTHISPRTLLISPITSSDLLPDPFNRPQMVTRLDNTTSRSSFVGYLHPSGILTFPSFPSNLTINAGSTPPIVPTNAEEDILIEDTQKLIETRSYDGCGLTVGKGTRIWWMVGRKGLSEALVMVDLRSPTPFNELDRSKQTLLLTLFSYAIASHRDANPADSTNQVCEDEYRLHGKHLLSRATPTIPVFKDQLEWTYLMEYTVV